MSRVHDALRRAAQEKAEAVQPPTPAPARAAVTEALLSEAGAVSTQSPEPSGLPGSEQNAVSMQSAVSVVSASVVSDLEALEEVIRNAESIPFAPAEDALLVDPAKPRDAPAEEFRSLRTRLNHLQRSQPLHTLVITSASPGEGKSFTASNLAMSHAQLAGKRVLLADFDFRRPSVAKTFGIVNSAGLTDYLLGKAGVRDILRRVAETNLYVIPAGETVSNPLELLNLPQCGALLEALRDHFDWVILDSPPLLFAADGNLLSTMADGTILVVRIGTTTYDSVARALQSLCENNVLGTVVNGAHRGELYSKYSYYHNYYYEPQNPPSTGTGADTTLDVEPVGTPQA